MHRGNPAQLQKGVSIAVFRRDQVLLVRRAHEPYAGLWSLPGGRIEPGENARQAALRELSEETGLCASELAFVLEFEPEMPEPGAGAQKSWTLSVFACSKFTGKARAGDDASAVRWTKHGRLPEGDMTPGTAEIITRIWSMRQ